MGSHRARLGENRHLPISRRSVLQKTAVFSTCTRSCARCWRKKLCAVMMRNAIQGYYLKIKVFRHFPRTTNVKKSRDQCLAIRFAVSRSRFERLDHALEVRDLPQGFLHPKTSQSHVWEEILLFRTLSLINHRIIFHRNVLVWKFKRK